MSSLPEPSSPFKVWANGLPVRMHASPVALFPGPIWHRYEPQPHPVQLDRAAFCHIEADGPVELEVEFPAPIAQANAPRVSARVLPTRHDIAAVFNEGRARFRVEGPAKLVVEPDDSLMDPVFIFVSPTAQPSPAPQDCTHYYGPGEHVVGVVELASDSHVYLHRDAVVRGHFTADCQANIRLHGHGIIDNSLSPGHRDTPSTNRYGAHRPTLSFKHCRNVTVEGLHIINSPSWNVQVFNTTGLTVRDVRIVACRNSADGIDLVSCENAVVEDCFVRAWDDCLCVKTQLSIPGDHGALWSAMNIGKGLADWDYEKLHRLEVAATRDLVFRQCVIWNDRAHPIEIGYELSGIEVTRVLFEDIDILHARHYPPIDITLGDRALVHGITFRDIRIEDYDSPFVVSLNVGEHYCSVDWKFGLDFGRIRDIAFERIQIPGTKPARILLHGVPLAADRIMPCFPPLAEHLPVLRPETLPKPLLRIHPLSGDHVRPLIENLSFLDWTTQELGDLAPVTPELCLTPATNLESIAVGQNCETECSVGVR